MDSYGHILDSGIRNILFKISIALYVNNCHVELLKLTNYTSNSLNMQLTSIYQHIHQGRNEKSADPDQL